ncbi:hypothetical protein ACIREE_02580 [Streptomyces sp. NPDC102467]|uniref:hypothetical protein n=1 Tax=Streptomyces sp. NPDC102467 TaxID=3366179 RepID=UPI003808FE91
MRRPALLRSAVITAALGGAVLVPTAASADPAVHAHEVTTVGVSAPSAPRERPTAQAPDDAGDDATANPYFLVAGGAMAAAGAAGLVYSTVRRGRADA